MFTVYLMYQHKLYYRWSNSSAAMAISDNLSMGGIHSFNKYKVRH